jgi:hypothetical protein
VAQQPDIERAFPTVAEWVSAQGWIEIGVQDYHGSCLLFHSETIGLVNGIMSLEPGCPTLGGCAWTILSSVGSSLLGGGVGLWLGIEAARGKDSIFPVWQVAGLMLGLVAGPVLLAMVRNWNKVAGAG